MIRFAFPPQHNLSLFEQSPAEMLHVPFNLFREMLQEFIHLFLGTRMNTDYQDIKSCKKPIIVQPVNYSTRSVSCEYL